MTSFDVSGIIDSIGAGMWLVVSKGYPVLIAFASVRGGIWAWVAMRRAVLGPSAEDEWLEANAEEFAEDAYWDDSPGPLAGPELFDNMNRLEVDDEGRDMRGPDDEGYHPIDGPELLDDGVRVSGPQWRGEMGDTHPDDAESSGWDGRWKGPV